MNTVAMRLPSTVTIGTYAAIEADLLAVIASGRGVLHIDASGVVEMDSMAIAVLLYAQRLARRAGRPGIDVLGAPPALLALLRVYGVDSLMSLSPAMDC